MEAYLWRSSAGEHYHRGSGKILVIQQQTKKKPSGKAAYLGGAEGGAFVQQVGVGA